MKVMAKSNLRITRIKKGFSTVTLAEKVGLSKQAIGQLERGNNGISPENAQRILEVLDVSFDDVFVIVGTTTKELSKS